MVFTRFVEVGRVAIITDGPDTGKLCVIIDVVDQKKALIDGPAHGVKRQALQFNRMSLLDYTIKIPRSAREKTVKKAWAAAEIDKQWAESSRYKKTELRKRRAALTDFQRFKVKLLKRERQRIIRGKEKLIQKGK
ncbi:PREDICTED: 60S ribosomal protein L14-like [Amphimedon queenslandica]|uniref:Large ribosomal subunit protein eL14 n=1 Tax=Amphimedon queenslandica TaxID=400682 RepID=A0A1X7VND5_AMPQE|nr:PREDICTED: 60S ribosomal protein L14-like [Amphimedon queenslandica]|eukprot:XP_003383796.1 PREDICTED: 60S ribosomal protein L14-like [Amphimedon queenslandica]